MTLIELLDVVAKKVSEQISYINSGGCCVYAALIAQHLQCHVPTQIVVADDTSEDDLDGARSIINDNDVYEWNNAGIRFGHVIVEFVYDGETYFYDSQGVVRAIGRNCDPTFGYPILKGRLTVQEAVELANSPTGWNRMFCRDDIPTMRKIIDKMFKCLNV